MKPFSILLPLLLSVSPAGTVPLAVHVTGIDSPRGSLMLALFDSPDAFDAGADPVRRASLPVAEGSVTWVVKDLPEGDYALKAYHDRDDSGALERNGFGAPKEPYGFSNDARGRFGPPSWEKARFRVTAPETTIRLRLK
jgi:uncharacterized protein (DUF2141 family)